jgi:hypothetical protein
MKTLVIFVSIIMLISITEVAAQGPVVYYRMEEGSGTILTDSSGNGFNGKIIGGTSWLAGPKGLSMSYSGSSQWDTVPHNASLNITSAITIALWASPARIGTQDLVKKAKHGSINGYEFTLATTSGSPAPNRPFVRFNQPSSGDDYRLSARFASVYPIDGTWVHYTATYDGDTIKFYINGVLDTLKYAKVTIGTNNIPLSIGAEWDGNSSRIYQGRLDEVRIYNRALNAAEVYSIAQVTRAWTGTTSTFWNVGSNWNPQGVPTNATDVIINSSVNPITLTANSTCRSLVVNSGATLALGNFDLTISGNATINGNITFGTGRINLAGQLTRNITGAGIKYLLSSKNYIEVPLTKIASVSSITIQPFANSYPPSTPGSYDSTKGVKRFYTISNVTGTGLVNLTLDYLAGEKGSNFQDPTNGSLWQYKNSGPWLNKGGIGAANYITAYGLDPAELNGEYTIAKGDAALPVQLALFIGNFVGDNVRLEWQTVSEVNNFGFNVQRYNSSSKNYETIGFVVGMGTTFETQNYSFLDENVTGNVEYHLEQIDNNGLKNYFGPIVLNPNSAGDDPVPSVFKLNQNYPNPFNPRTHIKFSVDKVGHASVIIYNIFGQQIARVFDGTAQPGFAYKIDVDASRWSSGIYYYRLATSSRSEIMKMVLIK